MRVLLIGATGNLGQRLVTALLAHNHSVTAYVRSTQKLQSLLPAAIFARVTVIEGDAKDSSAIKNALTTSASDALINTAGLAAVAPWSSSDLPQIFRAVVDAALETSRGRQRPLRAWFLGGLGVLHYPGTQTPLSRYVPVYLEHRGNLALLQSLDGLDWSMLCPAVMVPESTTSGKLVAQATSPPAWREGWVRHVPLLGRTVVCALNMSRYTTTLEQNAELIAADLESDQSQWSGKTVGIIDPSQA